VLLLSEQILEIETVEREIGRGIHPLTHGLDRDAQQFGRVP
jgi:hypothetical protein